MTGQHVRAGVWRRVIPLALVAGVLALGGLADVSLNGPPAPAAPVAGTPEAAVSLAKGVSSTAWYCPGPLAIGAGAPPAAIVIANVTAFSRHVGVKVAAASGAIEYQALIVKAGSSLTFALPTTGPRRLAAATVVVEGTGVGVAEVAAANPNTAGSAPLSAPCRDRTAHSAYLAAGGSHNADHVSLALYDPGATPAVARVTLATSTGAVAPPSFAGVAVGAGQVVVLDVSRAAPGRAMIATAVSATGGRLVVGAFLTVARGHGVQTALAVASPSLARSWSFPPAPAGPGTAKAVAVFNPGTRPSAVALVTDGSGGPAKVSATVPPGGVTALATGGVATTGTTRAARLQVVHGPPVAAMRELVVEKALAAAHTTERVRTVTTVRVHNKLVRREQVAVHVIAAGPNVPKLLPALPPGYSIESGVSRPGTTVLLPYGRADSETGEVITLFDPGDVAAKVHLRLLAAAVPVAARLPASLVVPAGGVLTLALTGLISPPGPVAIVVRASAPIVAGGILEALGKKAVGLSAAGVLPIRK